MLSRASVYVLKSLDEGRDGAPCSTGRERALADLDFDDDACSRLIGWPTAMPAACSTCLNRFARRPTPPASRRWMVPSSRRRWRRTCAASTRAAMPSTTRFRPHKSVRGSNPDGALYWFCRMLDGGADPRYLARRIVRMAWEDIGLADPRAMQIANDAANTYERLGSPEGELASARR